MGKYLLDNYDKNYILELSKNKDLLEKETEKIFIHTVEYVRTKQFEIKIKIVSQKSYKFN